MLLIEYMYFLAIFKSFIAFELVLFNFLRFFYQFLINLGNFNQFSTIFLMCFLIAISHHFGHFFLRFFQIFGNFVFFGNGVLPIMNCYF